MASNLKNTTVDGDLNINGSKNLFLNSTNGNCGIRLIANDSATYFQVKSGGSDAGSIQFCGWNAKMGNLFNIHFSQVESKNIRPAADNTYDLGTSSCVWRNIYTGSLKTNGITFTGSDAFNFDAYGNLKATTSTAINYWCVQNSGGIAMLSVNAGTGNVGIGTDSPVEKLHVVGNAKIQGSIEIKTGGDNKLIFNNTDGEKYSKISFRENDAEYSFITANDTQFYFSKNLSVNGDITGSTLNLTNKLNVASDAKIAGKLTASGVISEIDGYGIRTVIETGTTINYVQVKSNGENAGNLTVSGWNGSTGNQLSVWFTTLATRVIRPTANNTYDLGTSSLKWKNVYADTFNGNLTGLATSATTADDATLFNGKDFYYYMSLAKYRYFDLAKFGNLGFPTVEISTDGTNFVESTNTALTQSLFIGEGSEYTITNSTTKAVRWTWEKNIASRFPECFVVQWATNNAVVNVKVETSQNSGTSWYDGTVTSSITTSYGASYVKFITRSTADEWIRLTLSSSATTKASNIHLLARRIVRNEAVEYPYRADALKDIYPWTTNTQSLGKSNYKWKNVYATTFNGNLTGLATSATTADYAEKVKITAGAGDSDRPILVTNEANNNSLFYPSTAANRATLNYATGVMKVKTINIKGSASSTATIESDNGTNIFIRSNGVIPFVVDGNVVRRSGSATGATLGSSTHPWYGVYGGTGNFTSNVAVGGNLTIAGSVTGTAFYEGSDMAYKTDIKPLVNRGSLKPVEYTLKKTGERQLGFIAQDVQELYPELVGKNEDDKLVLNYPNLTAVLAAQVNELREENSEIRKENKKLKEEIKTIKLLLEKLNI